MIKLFSTSTLTNAHWTSIAKSTQMTPRMEFTKISLSLLKLPPLSYLGKMLPKVLSNPGINIIP
jgi:hypothetical protein